MAHHVRRQIREALQALLAGLPATGDRVMAGRSRPLPAAHDPTLLIYARDERSQIASGGSPAIHDRELDLFVDGRVSVKLLPPDDLLDDIARDVEARIGDGQTLSGLVRELTLVRTAITSWAEGERQEGSVRMQFRALYSVAEGTPDEAV